MRRIYARLAPVLLLGIWLLWPPAALAETVTKSPSDQREYATFLLPNGLRAIVISDPETDKAAAAVDVAIGSSSDPNDRPGLAHFLEHMLFLGTKKYPKPGEYQSFISAHSGQHNAYTAYEHTNFFFDVDADYLEPALDRFAQFFVAPLFTPAYVEREKNAVNSEYQTRRKNDNTRELYAVKQIVNPAHPFHHFDIGSLATLADRKGSMVRDDLVTFYKHNYSANIMTLVVLGKEPVPVLERWVTDKFAAVANAGASPVSTTAPLFTRSQLPAKLNVVPLRDRRTMTLTFPISAVLEYYRSKPVQYVANLLGDEGPGSLLSLLKRQGWANTLAAGTSMNSRNSATFEVSMRLTKAGLQHVDQIAAEVFQYLNLIREQGLLRWIFEEQQRIADVGFRFQAKGSAINYVSALAYNLQVYPPAEAVHGPYAMDDYDPVLIGRILDKLTPENVLLTVAAKGLPTDARDPWFDTQYGVAAIDPQTIAEWRTATINAALALPKPNPFLPENLAVKPPKDPTDKPARIRKTGGLELWYRQDTTFRRPKADFYFSVRSPLANDSPTHAVLTELYVRTVNDELDEFAYPAALAGLNYDLYRHVRGFSVRVSGYNDKQAVLLARIAGVLAAPSIKPERFVLIKEQLAQRLRNANKEPPFRQTISQISDLLLNPSWPEDQRLAALQPLTPDDLHAFVPKLLSHTYTVVLAHGNLYRDDALAMTAVVEEKLLAHAVPTAVPRSQVVRLPTGKDILRELSVDHPDSAIALYAQGSDRRYNSRARALLAAQVLASPFYNDLRTEKQLGYVVFVTPLPMMEVPGIAFVIQSPTTTALTLKDDIDTFLKGYLDVIARMSEIDFNKQKQALIDRILTKEQNLEARSNGYWTELDRENLKFNTRERVAKAVQRISKESFEKFYKAFLLDKDRTRLTVISNGTKQKAVLHSSAPSYTLVGDTAAFKKNAAYFSQR